MVGRRLFRRAGRFAPLARLVRLSATTTRASLYGGHSDLARPVAVSVFLSLLVGREGVLPIVIVIRTRLFGLERSFVLR
jgi:hypothetical protein